ncbi:hypothetical protein ACLOJK_010735 [Asimina triloba]
MSRYELTSFVDRWSANKITEEFTRYRAGMYFGTPAAATIFQSQRQCILDVAAG